MLEIFEDAFVDTAKMVPLLLLIYVLIEFVEAKYGHHIRDMIKYAGKRGPLLGAAFGCVPQCGFSVISTALYTKGLVTMGTLMAVYLSTSDEAIPIILAQPGETGILLPLILTKVGVALVGGYAVDLLGSRVGNHLVNSEICATYEHENNFVALNDHPDEELGCCGHQPSAIQKRYKDIVLHPLVHTTKVFVFMFFVSALFNLVIYQVGEDNLSSFLMGYTWLQPFLAGLIGLIPNCASSVAITQVFLMGGISFGAAVAGLSSGAGLGLLVLLKENRSLKDSLRIIFILYAISVVAGMLIQWIYG